LKPFKKLETQIIVVTKNSIKSKKSTENQLKLKINRKSAEIKK